MTLVDTSVWVAHFRATERNMVELLETDRVLIHPMIIGELACGNLRNRVEILENLGQLPSAVAADQGEVLELIEARHLCGRGIGWIDAHLLASALITGCRLWTLDRVLGRVALELGVGWPQPKGGM
jgi:hypothetical protein